MLALPLSRAASLMRPSALRELAANSSPPRLTLAGGLPPADAFPFAAVGEVFAELMAAGDASALQYTSAEGDARLRALVATRTAAELGREVRPSDVIVTSGTQQAIDLVGRVLLDPGDVAIVERPTYIGALRALAPTGARVLGALTDGDGLDTDDLARRLADGLRPKLVYLVINFSNPSGATLSLDRRRQLTDLAERYGFVVIEDDQYGPLRFRGEHLPPISSMTDHAVYVAGFSKILAPGLRVGHVVPPAELVRPIVLAKQATDLAASSLGQRIVTALVERDGWLDAHVGNLRGLYRDRAAALVEAVRAELPGRLTVHDPEGGMFTWGRIGVDGLRADAVAAAARPLGLAIMPGNEFSPDGGHDHDLRFSYSMLTPDELREAVGLLRQAFDDATA